MPAHASPRGPAGLTAALATVLAAVATVAVVRSLLVGPDRIVAPVILVALTVAFFACEQFLMLNVEYRKQSHSLTLAGIPLVLGIFELPVHELVLARVVGAFVALALQRTSRDKLFYNLSSYAFEAAVATTVVHMSTGARADNLVDLAVVLLVVAVIDQITSGLVLFVIRLHGGRFTRAEVSGVLAEAAFVSATSAIFAGALAVLLDTGVVGGVLTCLLLMMSLGVYAAHSSASKRHASMRTAHDFLSSRSVGGKSTDALAAASLAQIRDALNARLVELVVPGVDGRVFTVDESDDCVSSRAVAWEDEVRVRAYQDARSTLVKRSTRDTALRSWLTQRQFRDAVVVPLLDDAGAIGVITVADRLGESYTFGGVDLDLLRVLATHLAVAWRNVDLVQQLAWDARHDALTGLPNRALLGEHIRARTDDRATFAVLMLDLDKFKEVNDVLGHAAGDRLLRVVADRLRACVPVHATVARLGGDEFAIMLPDHDEDAAVTLAGQIVAALERPTAFEQAMLSPAASVGVAVRTATPTDEAWDAVVRRADTAMYVAKNDRSRVAVYQASFDHGRAEGLALIADLRSALRERPWEFVVHYQPKIDLDSDRITGAEALVRWLHPTLGVIAPDRFIGLAETSGLIGNLTALVLDTATADCTSWPSDVGVAVNLSTRDLVDPALHTVVETALRTSGLASSRLILEVTESILMAEPEQAVAVVRRLADLGICISLDDFGTGYSSLSYLQKLAVGEVKIDRSFVAGLDDGTPQSEALIASVVAMTSALNMRTVAEGIETSEQARRLAALGCDCGQGYLFSRPVPAAAFMRLLAVPHATPTLVPLVS